MYHWLPIFMVLVNFLLNPIGHAVLSQKELTNQSSPPGDPPLQNLVNIENLGVVYQYGSELVFNARIETIEPVQEVLLFITPQGQQAVMKKISLDSSLEIHHAIETKELTLRPFTENRFHYVISLKNGDLISSESYSFRYDDNRFQWQSFKNSDFEIFWYGRDTTFGQDILNAAYLGLENATSIIASTPPVPIRIYVYLSSIDLQSALNLNQPWVVGHAAPDLGQMYLYIPKGDEQRLEIERQVPHEIMHFLQYRLTGDTMRRQPVWLMEGMASLAELYPNPEYQRVLQATAQSRELIPMVSLCNAFPREASGAFQAYAQSASFVRFLFQHVGSDGLKELMDQYNSGLGCEEGISSAFGTSLGQMENQWKQEMLGVDTGNLVIRNLSPYFIILLFIIVPTTLVLVPTRHPERVKEKT